jgi:hypothetical protein
MIKKKTIKRKRRPEPETDIVILLRTDYKIMLRSIRFLRTWRCNNNIKT